MRFPLAALVLGVVALAGSACASRNRRMLPMYGVTLSRPHVFELANGTSVPCGKGIAWLFGDILFTCAIDRRVTIQGHAFPAGAELWFHAKGMLEQARYVEREGTLAHGEGFRDTRVMTFEPSGK